MTLTEQAALNLIRVGIAALRLEYEAERERPEIYTDGGYSYRYTRKGEDLKDLENNFDSLETYYQ